MVAVFLVVVLCFAHNFLGRNIADSPSAVVVGR